MVRDEVAAVLRDPGYSEHAAVMRDETAAMPGVETAVVALESLGRAQ
jgi:hypothetical protein